MKEAVWLPYLRTTLKFYRSIDPMLSRATGDSRTFIFLWKSMAVQFEDPSLPAA